MGAVKAIDRPKEICKSRRKPPDVSPKASVRPVVMLITAMSWRPGLRSIAGSAGAAAPSRGVNVGRSGLVQTMRQRRRLTPTGRRQLRVSRSEVAGPSAIFHSLTKGRGADRWARPGPDLRQRGRSKCVLLKKQLASQASLQLDGWATTVR